MDLGGIVDKVTEHTELIGGLWGFYEPFTWAGHRGLDEVMDNVVAVTQRPKLPNLKDVISGTINASHLALEIIVAGYIMGELDLFGTGKYAKPLQNLGVGLIKGRAITETLVRAHNPGTGEAGFSGSSISIPSSYGY